MILVLFKFDTLADYGAFVEVEEGLEGLVHISEISNQNVGRVSDELKVGDTVNVAIMSIDPRERKISLSIKAFAEAEERADIETYVGDKEKKGNTLGDLLGDKLKGMEDSADEGTKK